MIKLDLATMSSHQIRELCRSGEFDRPTTGVAMDYVQVNLVILPTESAKDFQDFCHLNPLPCPLLEVIKPGQFEPVKMAPRADVRTDLPRYRVFRFGELIDQPRDLRAYWPDARSGAWELVAFLIGCSFTFESALQCDGIPVRHIEESKNVPMFRTTIPTRPAGPFSGPLVVSMRPMTPEQAQRAFDITTRLPHVHGAPVHIGDPTKLGIHNVSRPDYGDAVTIKAGEVPVFWACGVTPLEAINRAKPVLAITHEPGHMLVTDIKETDLLSGSFKPVPSGIS